MARRLLEELDIEGAGGKKGKGGGKKGSKSKPPPERTAAAEGRLTADSTDADGEIVLISGGFDTKLIAWAPAAAGLRKSADWDPDAKVPAIHGRLPKCAAATRWLDAVKAFAPPVPVAPAAPATSNMAAAGAAVSDDAEDFERNNGTSGADGKMLNPAFVYCVTAATRPLVHPFFVSIGVFGAAYGNSGLSLFAAAGLSTRALSFFRGASSASTGSEGTAWAIPPGGRLVHVPGAHRAAAIFVGLASFARSASHAASEKGAEEGAAEGEDLYLVSAGTDCYVRVWKVVLSDAALPGSEGKPLFGAAMVAEIKHRRSINGVALLPQADGLAIAVADVGCDVSIYAWSPYQ
jgi:hypothetical protein